MWPLLLSPNANFNCNLHVYFRKRASGPLLYQITARLGDVREKKDIFLKGKTKWKCNFTLLRTSCTLDVYFLQ